jgi:hypothetical protein
MFRSRCRSREMYSNQSKVQVLVKKSKKNCGLQMLNEGRMNLNLYIKLLFEAWEYFQYIVIMCL